MTVRSSIHLLWILFAVANSSNFLKRRDSSSSSSGWSSASGNSDETLKLDNKFLFPKKLQIELLNMSKMQYFANLISGEDSNYYAVDSLQTFESEILLPFNWRGGCLKRDLPQVSFLDYRRETFSHLKNILENMEWTIFGHSFEAFDHNRQFRILDIIEFYVKASVYNGIIYQYLDRADPCLFNEILPWLASRNTTVRERAAVIFALALPRFKFNLKMHVLGFLKNQLACCIDDPNFDLLLLKDYIKIITASFERHSLEDNIILVPLMETVVYPLIKTQCHFNLSLPILTNCLLQYCMLLYGADRPPRQAAMLSAFKDADFILQVREDCVGLSFKWNLVLTMLLVPADFFPRPQLPSVMQVLLDAFSSIETVHGVMHMAKLLASDHLFQINDTSTEQMLHALWNSNLTLHPDLHQKGQQQLADIISQQMCLAVRFPHIFAQPVPK